MTRALANMPSLRMRGSRACPLIIFFATAYMAHTMPCRHATPCINIWGTCMRRRFMSREKIYIAQQQKTDARYF